MPCPGRVSVEENECNSEACAGRAAAKMAEEGSENSSTRWGHGAHGSVFGVDRTAC